MFDFSKLTNELTKDQVIKWASDEAEQQLSQVDTFALLGFLTRVKAATEILDNRVREHALREMDRDPVERFGMEIKPQASGGRWDFKGDPTWIRLNEQLKDHEAFLKTIKDPILVQVDEETGEEQVFMRPIKGGVKEGVAVSLR